MNRLPIAVPQSLPTWRATVGRLAIGWDQAALLSLLLLIVLVVATYSDYGISNDEEAQQIYGEKLVELYLSGFADRSAFDYENLYLYGGLFDMIVVGLQSLLPWADLYEVRHLLSGLIGVSGIAATWRLARLFGGPRAGFLALAFLALTAPWYGAMFNHTKDIPFAATMAWLLYYSCRFAIELPRPGRAAVAGIAIAGGAALGLRVGAILGFAYLAVATGIWAIASSRVHGLWKSTLDVTAIAWRLAVAGIAAYAIMAFFWPWAVLAPLNPIIALKAFSHFKHNIDTLFDGRVIKMYAVPPNYAPVYFIVRMPIFALVGLGADMLFKATDVWRRYRTGHAFDGHTIGHDMARFLLVAATFFPLAYAIATKPYLYSGLRHFLFVVPPLMVLAALGFERLLVLAAERGRAVVIGLGAILGVGGLSQAAEIIALHPHQYLSYNILVGGLPGAVGRWDTDYWSNIAPEAIQGIVELVKAEKPDEGHPQLTYRVAMCGGRLINESLPSGIMYANRWDQADFFVTSTHIGCQRAYPRAPIVFTVARMGATIGVVRDLRVLRRNAATSKAPTPAKK
ncbi:MAG: hypothetical protein EXQ90_07340 [Rhodospirillales bacterium]|nr:hypothetical protein [Rhodospirillales bacterium]